MSCLEECCLSREPEAKTAPWNNQTTAAQTLSTWPAEGPDEAADGLAVNGLEGMAPCLVSGSSLGEKKVPFKSSKSSVAERIHTTDLDILRGITLRDSLRSRGSLWRKDLMYLPRRK